MYLYESFSLLDGETLVIENQQTKPKVTGLTTQQLVLPKEKFSVEKGLTTI
jgi:hypothetical protein